MSRLSDGNTSVSGTLYGTQVSLSADRWEQIVSAGFPADICVCDPKVAGWAHADRVD